MYNVNQILQKNQKKLNFMIMAAFSYTSINKVLHQKDDYYLHNFFIWI